MTNVTGKLVGWRQWRVGDDGELLPGFRGGAWQPGENVATCATGHAAPDSDCHCGLHAYYALPDGHWGWGGTLGHVKGVVLAWGAVELHPDGFRAERMQPLCLVVEKPGRARHVLLGLVAERYGGLPVLSREEALALALEYGRSVPAGLIPVSEPPPPSEPPLPEELVAELQLREPNGNWRALRIRANAREIRHAGGDWGEVARFQFDYLTGRIYESPPLRPHGLRGRLAHALERAKRPGRPIGIRSTDAKRALNRWDPAD